MCVGVGIALCICILFKQYNIFICCTKRIDLAKVIKCYSQAQTEKPARPKMLEKHCCFFSDNQQQQTIWFKHILFNDGLERERERESVY